MGKDRNSLLHDDNSRLLYEAMLYGFDAAAREFWNEMPTEEARRDYVASHFSKWIDQKRAER